MGSNSARAAFSVMAPARTWVSSSPSACERSALGATSWWSGVDRDALADDVHERGCVDHVPRHGDTIGTSRATSVPRTYGRRVQEDAIRRRVEAFVGDYHERWLRAGQNPSDAGFGPWFDGWRAEVEALDATHGAPGWRSRYEGSLSMHPAHDPATERLDAIEVDGERATAHSTLPGHIEYLLRVPAPAARRRLAGRPGLLVTSLVPPGVPLLPDLSAAALLARATDEADLSPLPEHLALDVPLLFTAGRSVELARPDSHHRCWTSSGTSPSRPVSSPSSTSRPSIRAWPCWPGGSPRARTPSRSRPCERRTSPSGSSCPTCRASSTAGQPSPTGRPRSLWTPGTWPWSTVARYVTADAQRIEAICQEQIGRLVDGEHATFALGGASVDAVLVSSGFGDGGYPTYWGLNSHGGLAEARRQLRGARRERRADDPDPFRPRPGRARRPGRQRDLGRRRRRVCTRCGPPRFPAVARDRPRQHRPRRQRPARHLRHRSRIQPDLATCCPGGGRLCPGGHSQDLGYRHV